MAVIIEGKTVCPLCGKTINEGQEVVAFSHFVPNELDPIWMFSDGAFHATCFYEHPLAEKAQARWREIIERLSPGSRFCVVCKKEIKDWQDYFTLGYLVDDASHPLYHYNYTQAHRSHLSKWAELPYVYELIEDLRQSGTWQGDGLDRLSAELKPELDQRQKNNKERRQR